MMSIFYRALSTLNFTMGGMGLAFALWFSHWPLFVLSGANIYFGYFWLQLGRQQ
jgi:hypothetical protein